MAMMYGGPYDGLDISADLINEFCKIVPFDSQRRLFFLMPPLEHWDAIVIRTVSAENENWKFEPYERVARNGEFVLEMKPGAFEDAVRNA